MNILFALVLSFLYICQTDAATQHSKCYHYNNQKKCASFYTIEHNKAFLKKLPFTSMEAFERAQKNHLAQLPSRIQDTKGNTVWDITPFKTITHTYKQSPHESNPSLFRQLQLLNSTGLFKVTDRLYQIRGADLANMSIVEGKTGLIIIDPLMSAETARASLDLYFKHRPKVPIKAVIFSHSHIDHYGGIKGIVTEQEVAQQKIAIIAPEGFEQAALTENVFAGNVMARRSSYQYGNLVEPGPDGNLGTGLGHTTSTGTVTYLSPNNTITTSLETMNIDGLTFEFLLTPNTEAPSEMYFYIPELKALSTAENGTHTMHNIYTLRGAKIRNAKEWAHYLYKALELWGDKTEVLYGMHHWPVWGTEQIQEYLTLQADTYSYMHDQTLRLANHGLTMNEIAETLTLPEKLEKNWSMRGYYGTVNHNVKSIYVYYLGWYDGNPAHLHPLPDVQAAQKYVAYMGGSTAIIEKAENDYQQGNYRWVAQVLTHVVYAEPHNQKAKQLQADAFEQLGYQSEAGTWRNWYLSGAQELRNGIKKIPSPKLISKDTLRSMPVAMLLDYLAIRLNGPKAADADLSICLYITDTKTCHHIRVRNGILRHSTTSKKDHETRIEISRTALDRVLLKHTTIQDEIQKKHVIVKGDTKQLEQLVSLLDTFTFWFPLVTPRNKNIT